MPGSTNRTPSTLFASLVGLVSLAVLVQAITAGIFVNQEGRDGWVTVHGVIADVTWVCALATAIVAFRTQRPHHRRLWRAAALLFVTTLVQTGIGHLITEHGVDALIAVHVPLAMVIFGLTVWLAAATASARRAAPADPYGAGAGAATAGASATSSERGSRMVSS